MAERSSEQLRSTHPASPGSAPGPKAESVHVMAKPSGAVCNLDCTYCYYLEKERLYPERGRAWRMSDETLERYVRQYIEAQDVPEVSFAWQGGEPTLMGLDFYRKAVALQERYAAGKTIRNSLQTNGTLLDDAWGAFLAEHDFLVGISIDGPHPLHDRHRLDKGGAPTFERVVRGLDVLKRHGVEFNTLTTVHAGNEDHPLEVYRFLVELGSRYLQFIPIVERVARRPGSDGLALVAPGFEGEASVSEWSVSAGGYGRFLREIFDEWVRHDVGRVFVQMFDAALGAWLGLDSAMCIFAETCGDAMVLEQNGDLYACDHFVYPGHLRGNIGERSIREMAFGADQQAFGDAKRDALPGQCRACAYRFACNGGCPKHRFARTPDGEEGLNYLCPAYMTFFAHVDPYMRVMARELTEGRTAAGVMGWAQSRDAAHRMQTARRNDPCPCGSGRKFKHCHGREA